MTERVEYKARLPWIDKIPTHVLEGRVHLGLRKTLEIASATSESLGKMAYACGGGEVFSKEQRDILSACNFSSSQCVKELKKRGVKVKA